MRSSIGKMEESFWIWGPDEASSEFVIRKMAGWAVDQFLEGNCDNRILMLCPLTLLHEDLENRRREEYLTVFGDASEEEWDLYEEVLTVITYQKLEQLCKGDASDHRAFRSYWTDIELSLRMNATTGPSSQPSTSIHTIHLIPSYRQRKIIP